ncbi:ABC transporter permease [Rudaeicoccus suwonensis]|uniref:Uncharacterized protein UPF0014 n=1 Tax=Rudaeicoccus suwonensis TaxID=657409 RepID=A0A561E7W3_9MICO|nr:ABC transporter permease [Rudaeicoccus suwonensis]TWE11699.1 uncharacterized protein UPF0014 [Rudaeicoccus suwonensis]
MVWRSTQASSRQVVVRVAVVHAQSSSITQISGAGDVVLEGGHVVVAAIVACLVVRFGRLGGGRDQVSAAARAVVQLGGVGLVITAVLRSWPATVVFCAAC